jgi:hypothetical protein
LADPGQSTAIALSQITTTFLATDFSSKSSIWMLGLQRMAEAIQQSFVSVQFHVEEEELGHRLVDEL